MKKWFVLLGIFILLSSLTGCFKAGQNAESSVSAVKEKTVTVCVPKLPITLNPIVSNSFFDTLVFSQVSEPLIKFDPKTLEPIAGVAKSWDVKGGRIFTFYLNDNVYFSNGKHCTARDFKYSYEKYLTPESPGSYMLEAILGSRDKLKGKAEETKGIKVLDDLTLEITLKEPNNNFLSVLASPCLVVLDKEEVDKAGPNFGTNTVVGIGPFKILGKTSSEIILGRNDKYYSKKAYVNEVKFIELSTPQAWAEYEKGKIDFMFDLPNVKTLINDPKYKKYIRTFPYPNTVMLYFNLHKEPLKSNLKLREAVTYAINKEKLDAVFSNYSASVADSITPPSLSGRHNTTPPSYNKEKAKTFLAEAGYPGGKGLPELNLTYHDRTFQKRLVESIRDDLAAVNIKVKLVHADEKLAIPYVEGVSDLYRTSWVPDYLDIDAFIQPILYSRGYANCGFYNQTVDTLIDKARLTPGYNERKNLLAQAEMTALKEYPLVPLYWGQDTTITSPRVKNLQISPNGYPLLENVMIEE